MAEAQDIPCVGICLPDEDEAYCIGCGRPWGSAPAPAPSFHVIERGWLLAELKSPGHWKSATAFCCRRWRRR